MVPAGSSAIPRLPSRHTCAILDSPAGQAIKAMATYSAVGEPSEVKADVARFAKLAHADEVMTVHPAPRLAARLRSIELLAASQG